jgi:hypothetical protein
MENRGFMKGHGGWITCMQVGEVVDGDQKKEFLITGSRDKTLMIWDIKVLLMPTVNGALPERSSRVSSGFAVIFFI